MSFDKYKLTLECIASVCRVEKTDNGQITNTFVSDHPINGAIYETVTPKSILVNSLTFLTIRREYLYIVMSIFKDRRVQNNYTDTDRPGFFKLIWRNVAHLERNTILFRSVCLFDIRHRGFLFFFYHNSRLSCVKHFTSRPPLF